jgi:hypothetical protein
MAGILKVDTIQNSNTSTIITQTNSTTITIGTTGQTVSLASGASSSGFGATYNGAVNWSSTVRTSGFTAVSGNGYFCNTTSAEFTVTLPASAAIGDILSFKDYAKTWNKNNLTLNLNGLKAEGSTANPIQSTQGQSITLVYVDSTKGWVITDSAQSSELSQIAFVAATGGTILTCGSYKTHVFTGPGSFCVSCAGNPLGGNSVEYIIIAGGGGGGASGGGGGGAGGFRQNYPSPALAGLPVTATTYPITVGSGGAAAGQGNNSIFSTITSSGGGLGDSMSARCAGVPGGSGGGGARRASPNDAGNSGGVGNSPPVSPSQGNNGGSGTGGPGQNSAGGGGGGIGGTGPNSSTSNGGPGGIGSPLTPAIFGPTAPSYGTAGPAPGRYFAGGGGGGSFSSGGSGGSGGGGAGTTYNGTAGTGTTNTGGGGGGGGTACGVGSNGSAGGSGIVVIRYKFQ